MARTTTMATPTQANKYTDEQPLEQDIIYPHSNDVLCGRGGETNKHIGNVHWRRMVKDRQAEYIMLPSRKQKMELSRSIVKAVRSQNPPGRFLQRDSKTYKWFDVGDKWAQEKTTQALREGAPELRKKQMAAAKVDAKNETTEKPGDKQDVPNNIATTPVTWNGGWTSASTTTKTKASANIQSTPAAQPTPAQAAAVEPHHPHHIRNGRNGGAGWGFPLMLAGLPAAQPTSAQEEVAAVKATQPQQQVNVLTPTPPEYTDKPSLKQDILRPHPHDVLFGRGKESNKHPGNVHWRKIVCDRKNEYIKLGKHRKPQKMMIPRSIIKAVKNQKPPGRFLAKDSESHRWFEVEDKEAIQRTSQALRDCAAEVLLEMAAETDKVDATDESTENPGGKQNAPNNSTITPVTWDGGWATASTATKTRASTIIQSTSTAQPSQAQAAGVEPAQPQRQQQNPHQQPSALHPHAFQRLVNNGSSSGAGGGMPPLPTLHRTHPAVYSYPPEMAIPPSGVQPSSYMQHLMHHPPQQPYPHHVMEQQQLLLCVMEQQQQHHHHLMKQLQQQHLMQQKQQQDPLHHVMQHHMREPPYQQQQQQKDTPQHGMCPPQHSSQPFAGSTTAIPHTRNGGINNNKEKEKTNAAILLDDTSDSDKQDAPTQALREGAPGIRKMAAKTDDIDATNATTGKPGDKLPPCFTKISNRHLRLYIKIRERLEQRWQQRMMSEEEYREARRDMDADIGFSIVPLH
eukprot:scaffold3380_cov106-Cylindrotheca_fusiformis.AAC.6